MKEPSIKVNFGPIDTAELAELFHKAHRVSGSGKYGIDLLALHSKVDEQLASVKYLLNKGAKIVEDREEFCLLMFPAPKTTALFVRPDGIIVPKSQGEPSDRYRRLLLGTES
jgi:hypothetical protein